MKFALMFLLASAMPVCCQAQYGFTNFAGLPGAVGTNDGIGSTARFERPTGVALDGAANVYVADRLNHTIRKITPAGVVTTLAGGPGLIGTNDGIGGTARFNYPSAVALDSSGNIYVADQQNHTIRAITPAGAVTTLAGNASQPPGSANGTGSMARFNRPSGVAVDSTGNVYVGDQGNHTIRKIAPGGVVTTLAGQAGSFGSVNGTGSAARFTYPFGVAVDSLGNVYVADTSNHTIRKITPGAVVTTFAGVPGLTGSANGTGSAARFNTPTGVGVDGMDNLYVADYLNHTIRKITPSATVRTLAGLPGVPGSANGAGSAARFDHPFSVAVDSVCTIYLADEHNNRITKGTPPSRLQFDASPGSVTLLDGLFQMRLIGPGGTNVVLEASANLASWTPVQTNALPPCGLDLSVPVGASQYHFFRARLAP